MSRYFEFAWRGRGRKPAARACGGRHRTRPFLEVLEDRAVPTVSISVANVSLNEIGTTSAFITAGSGGLSSPGGITLGPDGNVYVADNNGAVLRYNAATGAYISTFVSQGSGGLSGLSGNCLAFGPDGNLYVSSANTNQVLEYNGSTGAFIKTFIAAGSGGLTDPRGLTFGPDGNLYVTSFNVNSGANGIMRYQGPLATSPGSPLPATGQSGAAFVAQYERRWGVLPGRQPVRRWGGSSRASTATTARPGVNRYGRQPLRRHDRGVPELVHSPWDRRSRGRPGHGLRSGGPILPR
jgi:hypothetical protein